MVTTDIKVRRNDVRHRLIILYILRVTSKIVFKVENIVLPSTRMKNMNI